MLLLIFVTNSSWTVFFIISVSTTLRSILISARTISNSSTSILPTSAFKLVKSRFNLTRNYDVYLECTLHLPDKNIIASHSEQKHVVTVFLFILLQRNLSSPKIWYLKISQNKI